MRGFVAVLLSLIVTCVVASPALADMVTLRGEVTYRERIALPPGATLAVELVDLATAGEPARIRAEAPIVAGQVPLAFTLSFDHRMIEAGHDYGLVAEISSDGTVWFRNTNPHALVPLQPKEPLVVVTTFTGRVPEQPATPSPPEVAATPPILDITWRAESVGGEPVVENADTTLSIERDMRAGGRGGCNSYFTQAEINGESLRFSAVAATQMACPSAEVTEQETSFFAALAATRFWRIRGGKLVLLDAGGRDVVVLAEAVR